MSGILPETASGGVITRSAGGIPTNPSNVSNVYVPPEDFAASCALTALPDDCTAKITAAQINAIVSELMCFAATLNPTGTWTCSSLCNLATNFEGWLTTFGPVMSFNGRSGDVTLLIGDLLALDGAGSGLDADLLDGVNGAAYALLASPTFTGVPAAPTAAPGTNTTQLATTAFVEAAVAAEGVNSFNTRTGAVVLAIGDLTALDGAGSGLDADLLDGQDGSYYLAAASYTAADVLAKLLTVDGTGSGIDADYLDGQSGAYYLAAASYTAADVLAKLLTVDGAGSGIDADLLDGISSAAFALLASPTFTGTPAAPTAAPGTNTTQIATTAFVTAAVAAATAGVSSFNTRTGAVTLVIGDLTAIDGAGSGLDADLLDGVNGAAYALLASPTFTGTPAAPTAAPGTNTTQIATTAFVTAAAASTAALLGSWDYSGNVASVEITFTADTYAMIIVEGEGLSPSGSAYLQTSIRNAGGAILTLTHAAANAGAGSFAGLLAQFAVGRTGSKYSSGVMHYLENANTEMSMGTASNATSADRVRVAWSAGNIDAGSIRVYGLKAA